MRSSSTGCTLVAGVAVLALAACTDGSGPSADVVTIVAGDGQSGLPGETLPIPLQIRLTTNAGAPVAGVRVRWEVTGDIAIAQSSSTSGADGTAFATVVLGSQPGNAGVNAVTTAGTASFSVLVLDPCRFVAPLTLGQTVSGTITNRDCPLGDGTFFDIYGFSLTATRRVRLTMRSSAFDAFLFLVRGDTDVLGLDDDGGGGTDAQLDALLPPGTGYQVLANTLNPGESGPYSLQSADLDPDLPDCEVVWVETGVVVSQTLPNVSCTSPDNTLAVADHLLIVMGPSSIVTIEMTAAAFAAQTRIFASGAVVASGTAAGPGQTALASFALSSNQVGVVALQFSAADGAQAGGAYTMTVFRTQPGGIRDGGFPVPPAALRSAASATFPPLVTVPPR
jgi:hypothetical protein